MDSTVKALKNLYAALGGNAGDVANISRIPDMIEAIATVAEAATAKELPVVTASNNGQVLTVAEGAWTVANVPTELPPVTADNNGDVLTVVNGAWAANTPEP